MEDLPISYDGKTRMPMRMCSNCRWYREIKRITGSGAGEIDTLRVCDLKNIQAQRIPHICTSFSEKASYQRVRFSVSGRVSVCGFVWLKVPIHVIQDGDGAVFRYGKETLECDDCDIDWVIDDDPDNIRINDYEIEGSL